MATLLSLKRRIQTAQNVSKTTRAMQMIAASKLKKAQNSALSLRAYADKLIVLSQNLSTKIDKESLHYYMVGQLATKKTLVIILSPDKGLCGSLITNLLREFLRINADEKVSCVTVGKKIEHQIINFAKNEILASFPFGTITPTFDMVYPITRIIDEYFMGKKVDSVKVLYSHFESVFTQKTKVATLLPITIPQDLTDKSRGKTYLFEPDLNTLLPSLLNHYLQMTLYQYLLESFASEQGARMIAMQNATSNAKEVISELRLEYNKSRQEKITNEILDITNTGASKYG